jgi:hypothetical protein
VLARVLRSRWFMTALAVLLIGGGLLAILQGLGVFQATVPQPTATPSPTRAAERLVPTPTSLGSIAVSSAPAPTKTWTSVREPLETLAPKAPTSSLFPTASSSPQGPTVWRSTSTPSATPKLASNPRPSETPASRPGLFSPRQRVGLVAPQADIERYDAARLGAGWYLTGITGQAPPRPGGMEFAQLVQVMGNSYQPEASTLEQTARSNPGALWLLGNEPDVIWQDNATPYEYAQVYYDVYHLLKGADPSAQVAIGGVSQVTSLRLRYLEEVLVAYQEAYGQPMPVDVWNIHVAILREERGSWGVDIPPGMADDTGILYEIEDNANVGILKEQVRTFRRWMEEQGQRNKPLIVTEFSVLMPPEYGFPFETVRDYMYDAFDFLLAATDGVTGLSADGNRLVQRFAWYSIADKAYYTGNLFDPETAQITSLGEAFTTYMSGLSP